MPKPGWNGRGVLDKGVGLRFASNVAQIRKVPRPAHSYGSPAADLKKEQAEDEAREAAESAEAKDSER